MLSEAKSQRKSGNTRIHVERSEIPAQIGEHIIIIDFGSQYTQLIARRVRELNVYCEIRPYNKIPHTTDSLKGVILSGSPRSINDKEIPDINLSGILGKVPVLGICYGAQLIAYSAGADILPSKIREYGRVELVLPDSSLSMQPGNPSRKVNEGFNINSENKLLKGIKQFSQVWMSHGDTISNLPENYQVIASTSRVNVAAYKIKGEETYGLQFHPEVTHTTEGKTIFTNFIINICGCARNWIPAFFITSTVDKLKNVLGNDKVVLGLSGGVDSTVAAVLLSKAIGNRLNCIFVDNGLLRKGEFQSVLKSYKRIGLNIRGVDARDKFYSALAGLKHPEDKRKAIGKTFINIFDEQAHKIKDVKWLAQGTIYPDVIESVSVSGPSVTIKSHHNVGGLPKKMKLKIIEPLNTLFKDEVRVIGKHLNIDKKILSRHPFPGPGLAIRIIGEVTQPKLAILQEADNIFISGLKREGLYDEVWQAGVMLLPVQSVGVMGDKRTYENVVSLRAVTSTDGMTADWAHLPYEFLANISNQIINKVVGVNRVVYDISSKPPATIEWE